MSTILLSHANIITEEGSILLGYDIVTADGMIASIRKSNESIANKEQEAVSPAEPPLPAAYLYDEVIDCSDYYITPGMPNLHCHCAMNFFKGIAEDCDADTWFNKRIFPYESQLTGDDVYVGTKLGIAEMLNCGVTTFADHYFNEKDVAKAVLEMGIRADIAPTIFGIAPGFEERLDEVSEFCEEYSTKSDLLAVRMGPHAPYTCPPPTLKAVADRAKELNLKLHLHVSETALQVEQSLAAFGKTPYQMCYEAGVFDLPTIIGHGLWITEDDFKYINEKTWFAECAKTYGKLSMGTGLVFANRSRLNYAFGTDGAASSNTLNIAEQARFFAILGKQEYGDPADYEALALWRAMMRGHEAFSFHTGKIKEGYAADLVIWDLNRINTFPVYNPITAILYSSEPSNVRHTMVNGVFRKKDGHLCIDEDELIREGKAVQKEILARGQGEAKVFY